MLRDDHASVKNGLKLGNNKRMRQQKKNRIRSARAFLSHGEEVQAWACRGIVYDRSRLVGSENKN